MPKKQPESFNIGDFVEWTSQSAGYTKTKAGVVVQIVAAGTRPDRDAFPNLYKHSGCGCGGNSGEAQAGRAVWPLQDNSRQVTEFSESALYGRHNTAGALATSRPAR